MATYEGNNLYKDSFSQLVCSKERLDALRNNESEEKPHGGHTQQVSSAGMFEMAPQYDIVNGRLAKDFFNALGPKNGYKFAAFKEKMHLLHDWNAFDLAHPDKDQ